MQPGMGRQVEALWVHSICFCGCVCILVVGMRNGWYLFIFSDSAIAFRGLLFKTCKKETWENEMFLMSCVSTLLCCIRLKLRHDLLALKTLSLPMDCSFCYVYKVVWPLLSLLSMPFHILCEAPQASGHWAAPVCGGGFFEHFANTISWKICFFSLSTVSIRSGHLLACVSSLLLFCGQKMFHYVTVFDCCD